jgi:Flp pilus assembly secretin CpaC/uncharacterized membrane protein YgcG
MIVPVLAVVGWTVAETVALNGNSEREMESTSVQLADGLIAPWAWKNVKEAVDGVAKQADLTINYSALNSVQLDLLTTRNVVLESRKPLHWKVLLSEVLRGLEFDYIQNAAGVVEIMPFARFHAYKTEEAERVLQNNHKTVEATFNRMPLLQALKELTGQAGVSLNTGYLPLEIRDPEAAAQVAAKAAELAAAKTDAKTAAAPPPPVKIFETSFKTITPMEWRNVLRNILDPYSFDFVEIGGAVCPMDKKLAAEKKASLLAAKPLIRQVVPVFYADPTDLMKRIGELGVLSPRGKISLTQSAGLNTMSGGSSSGGSSSGGSSRGGSSRGGSSGGGSSGSSSLRPRVREDLVVSDVEECVLQATEWIRKLDVSDGQVMIEGRILSINETDTKNLGVDWSGFDMANLAKLGMVENFGRYMNMAGGALARTNSPASTGLLDPDVFSAQDEGYYHERAMAAILGPANLTATLHALDQMENVEVLSHPLVVLGNRTEGRIDVLTLLQSYTVEGSTSVGTGGSASSQRETVEFIETPVGLKLWISPEISPDGEHVRLSVSQEMMDTFGEEVVVLSTLTASKNPIGRIWQTTQRTLDTRAMVKNGDTLVVGGLVTTAHTLTDSKVPFLGSIPLLGRLFSYKDEQTRKNNLVIMITPTILNEDTPATGYEPKSEAKANELSALGKDYFYNKPEKAEDGGLKTEDGDQGTGVKGQESGESNEQPTTEAGGQPEVNGVKPKTEVKLSEEAKLSPAEQREPDVKEIFQTLEAGGSGRGQKTEVSDQKAK